MTTSRASADPGIGDRIRDRRLLRGWSVRHAASRAGLSHATWSRIERGRQAADNRFVLADIAAALECAPDDLAGEPVPAADRDALAARAGVHAVRQALVDGEVPDDATGAEPAGAGPPVAELARTVALADALRQACDYAGTARLLPDLLRDLHTAAAGPDRRRALRLLCEATFIASSVVRNLGHPGEAWLAAQRCHEVALRTGDPVLLGYAAYARAAAATACGSYRRGLDLAATAAGELAPHTGSPGGSEMLGSLQLICAHASRGLRRPDESRAWSAEAAALAGRTGETTTMGLYFGPTNVNIWRVGIEADGGDPGRAAEIAAVTNPAAIAAGFRQVFFYADTARAYARLPGRDRTAVRYLLTAERLAPQHMHTSALAQETTRVLLERSRRAGNSALRGLAARMRVA